MHPCTEVSSGTEKRGNSSGCQLGGGCGPPLLCDPLAGSVLPPASPWTKTTTSRGKAGPDSVCQGTSLPVPAPGMPPCAPMAGPWSLRDLCESPTQSMPGREGLPGSGGPGRAHAGAGGHPPRLAGGSGACRGVSGTFSPGRTLGGRSGELALLQAAGGSPWGRPGSPLPWTASAPACLPLPKVRTLLEGVGGACDPRRWPQRAQPPWPGTGWPPGGTGRRPPGSPRPDGAETWPGAPPAPGVGPSRGPWHPGASCPSVAGGSAHKGLSLPICLLVSGRDGGTSAWRRGL